MNSLQKKTYDFSSVDPQRLERYLLDTGWKEESRIDDRAIIFARSFDGKNFQILLPLDKEPPDFASRIYDVFRTLEVVEGKAIDELVKAFMEARAIAEQNHAEILSLRFKFIENIEKTTFAAQKMGKVLTSLQDVYCAVGNVESGEPKANSQLYKTIKERTELSIIETFKGSFGIQFALSRKIEQTNLLEPNLEERVNEIFLDLIERSNRADKEALKALLLQLKRKAASQYRKFLISLIQAQTDLQVDWGSLTPNAGGSANLSYSNTINTVDFINKMEEEAPEEYEIIGKLISASSRRHTLEFEELKSKDRYTGQMSESLIHEQSLELTIERLYSATFQEITSINPATGEEKVKRTVISLEYWE